MFLYKVTFNSKTMAINQTAKAVWAKIFLNKTYFASVLEKVKLISASNGQCTAELTVAEEHSNRFGTLHGGLTATIVDCISGIALVSHSKRPAFGVSVDMHISYMKTAAMGETVVIEANTLRAGKTLAFLEVYIKKKEDGGLIAKGSHTKYIANGTGNIPI